MPMRDLLILCVAIFCEVFVFCICGLGEGVCIAVTFSHASQARIMSTTLCFKLVGQDPLLNAVSLLRSNIFMYANIQRLRYDTSKHAKH